MMMMMMITYIVSCTKQTQKKKRDRKQNLKVQKRGKLEDSGLFTFLFIRRCCGSTQGLKEHQPFPRWRTSCVRSACSETYRKCPLRTSTATPPPTTTARRFWSSSSAQSPCRWGSSVGSVCVPSTLKIELFCFILIILVTTNINLNNINFCPCQVFQTSGGRDEGLGDLDPETMQKIRNIRLTRSEFADSMGLQPTSLFVRNMFLLVDRSRDGFVSFDEFMNMFVTLSKGELMKTWPVICLRAKPLRFEAKLRRVPRNESAGYHQGRLQAVKKARRRRRFSKAYVWKKNPRLIVCTLSKGLKRNEATDN